MKGVWNKMQERNIVVAIILSIVTCGIYAIYWFIMITDEAKTYAEDTKFTSGGVAFLLSLVTCGIYGIYWAYQMGKIMEQAQSKNGVAAKDNSVLYLVLQIFGFAIINYALIQNDINEITRTKLNAA